MKRELQNPASYYAQFVGDGQRSQKAGWVKGKLCPFHQDRSTGSFFVNVLSGGFKCHSCGAKGPSIVHFHAKLTNMSLLEARAALLTGSVTNFRKPTSNVALTSASTTDFKKRQKNMETILAACVPLSDPSATAARLYLEYRGLKEILQDLPKDVFFHPSLSYYEKGKSLGKFPALVCIVRDIRGEMCTLHRTYLSSTGRKADVSEVRKLMSPCLKQGMRGCAIQLYPAGQSFGIAEGLETALAVRAMTGKPVWSAISAGNLVDINIPVATKSLRIFADRDENEQGASAAKGLRDKVGKNIKVEIFMPGIPPKGRTSWDWLDVKCQ